LRIAYLTQQRGNRDVAEKSASGFGEETPLLNSAEPETIDDFSPDGKYIIYRTGANTNTIHALPLFGERKPFAVVKSQFNKDGSHLSPDGKWLAYSAFETDTSQVYVVSFPEPHQKRQISTNGGMQPQWRGDGQEVFYLDSSGNMMSVDIVAAPTLSSGVPKQLFNAGIARPSFDAADYGVTADGKRFLLLKALALQQSAPPPDPPLTVIVNWAGALKDRK
jgi:hypothetical protein